MKTVSRVAPGSGHVTPARRPRRSGILGALVLAAGALSPPLGAQVRSVEPAACVPRMQVVDSLLNVVSVVVEVTDGHGRGAVRLPLDYLNVIVEEIAGRMHVPADVGGGVLMPMPGAAVLAPDDTLRVATPAVRASLAFTLHPDGSIDSVGLWGSTFNTALEEAVLAAILTSDSAGSIPAFPAGTEAKPLLMRVTVEPEQFRTERPPAELATRSELRPLFRMARPLIRISTLPVRGISTPAEEHDFRRVPARDTIRFVVSAEGAVLRKTLSVSHASYLEAGASELEWIMQARFRPGRVDDCPVPMLVLIPLR